jgi:cytochrome P450
MHPFPMLHQASPATGPGCPHAAPAPKQAPEPRTWADLPTPPSRWWGLSLLREMRHDYLGFTERIRRDHGDMVAMQIASERSVDIFDPEAARQVLVDHAGRTIRWERGIAVLAQVFGRSVFVTEGVEWKRQRRMLQPAFAPRMVAGQSADMVAAISTALEQLEASCACSQEVDLDRFFSSLTVRVIMGTLFGPQAQVDPDAVARATQVLSRVAMREMFLPLTLPDWLPLPGKAAKRMALRTLRPLIERQIDLRCANGASGAGLVDQWLSLRNNEGPDADGAPLSRREIVDQCIVTFQAGHETTATALTWWARLLAEHPQAMAKAQVEVDAALGGNTPVPDDLASLPWLTATLKEAMRLYPPAAALLTRRATADIVIAGVNLPKGTLLRITPWAIQRDARLFQDPTAFRPERFLPGASGLARGAWLAFGAGPRVCLGQHFAMLEATLTATILLQRFAWTLLPAAKPAEPQMNVTLRDAGGLRVQLRRRR